MGGSFACGHSAIIVFCPHSGQQIPLQIEPAFCQGWAQMVRDGVIWAEAPACKEIPETLCIYAKSTEFLFFWEIWIIVHVVSFQLIWNVFKNSVCELSIHFFMFFMASLNSAFEIWEMPHLGITSIHTNIISKVSPLPCCAVKAMFSLQYQINILWVAIVLHLSDVENETHTTTGPHIKEKNPARKSLMLFQ